MKLSYVESSKIRFLDMLMLHDKMRLSRVERFLVKQDSFINRPNGSPKFRQFCQDPECMPGKTQYLSHETASSSTRQHHQSSTFGDLRRHRRSIVRSELITTHHCIPHCCVLREV